MRGKRKLKVHWVNGVEEEKKKQNRPQYKKTNHTTHTNHNTRKTKPHHMAWEERRKVELGRVGGWGRRSEER